MARQELSCGITQMLAPVLDISRDSRMGRQGETYGEDPTLASAMGSAFVRGVQNTEVAGRKEECAAKHFLGFHNSQGGIHGANCDMGDRLLNEVYGKPFQAAISEASMRGIMPCYCSVNGEPLSASEKLLTGLLRDEMGFDGVCVSDYGAVGNVYRTQNVTESMTEAGLRCLAAGMDVELPSAESFNEELKEWFESGKAHMAILDQAVLRVLTAKFRMGLFEHPYALCGEELKAAFYDAADEEVSLQSARESLILLKNNGVLPLKKDMRKVAVIGCHGNNARSFFGGYTHLSMVEAVYATVNSLAGIGTSGEKDGSVKMVTVPGTQIQTDETEEFDNILHWLKPECKSLYAQIKEELPDCEVVYAYGYPIAGDDTSHFEEALDAAKDADVIILTLGGKHGSCSVASMGEGVDSSDINLPYCQDEFIKAAAKLGKPMVGVHFNGRPISSDIADEYLDAIVEAWNPSEMGAQAIAEVLLGDYNPSGKLPVSVARTSGQIPIYYNHPNGSAYHQGDSIGFKNYVDMPHTPRYFFGYGLSYTVFEYSDLTLDCHEIAPDGVIKVSLDIKNAGNVKGTEIVQLYLKDKQASMTRPVMELAGFAKVVLDAGETKHVTFDVSPELVAFLDKDMRWKVEKGEVEVMIGASSEDIRLRDSFMIADNRWLEGKNRTFYAKAAF